jgi:hypothetical protein
MSDPTEAVAAVLRRHEQMRDTFRQVQVCICDEWADIDDYDNGHGTHADHVAAAVLAALVDPDRELAARQILSAYIDDERLVRKAFNELFGGSSREEDEK